MREKVTLMMLIILGAILFVSCNNKIKELKEHVDKLNKDCPIAFNDLMTINSIMLQDDVLEIKYSANETIASISALNNHKEQAKESLMIGLSKETSKGLVDKIIDADVKLRAIFVGDQSNMRAIFEFTADELRKAQERFSNMSEAQKLVMSSVLGMILRLPLRIDYMTTMTELSITSSALIYKYEINDREMGNDFGQIGSLMKSITFAQMSSQISQSGFIGERNRKFYQALVDCGQCVKAEYYEVNTGARTSFEISVSEMKDVLSGKYQNEAPTMEDWENLSNAFEEFEEQVSDTLW